MNDDQLFLAHAYLDGELDDADRRAVESDPATMAEVERLRAVQAALIDVRPDPVRRERDIAAALVEFSARHDTAPPAYDPTPAAGATRPVATTGASGSGMRRWLGVAAAVVALGVLGVAVVYGVSNSGGSDDSSGSADFAGPAEESLDTATAESSRADAGDEAEGSGDGEADAPAGMADQADDEPAATEASESTEAAADAQNTLAESTAEPSRGAVAARLPDGPIAEPVELAAIGNEAVAAAEDGSLGSTPETDCTVTEPDSGLTYRVLTRHPVTVGDTTVDAFIGYVDTNPTAYVALDPDNCDVLMDATDALLR